MSDTDGPVAAGKAPMAIELEAQKTYYWCACGRSANQPFCDGSHKGTGLAPKSFTVEQARRGFLCLCKRTKNPPWCDGTHNSLA
jgi:CDGSH-type Zn-finger protein